MGRAANIANTAKGLLGSLWNYGEQQPSQQQQQQQDASMMAAHNATNPASGPLSK